MSHAKASENSSHAIRVRDGQLLPEISLTSAEGRPVRLSDYRGRSNLVLITADGGDEAALQLADEIAARYNDFSGQEAAVFAVLGPSSSAAAQAQQGRRWPFTVLADAEGRGRRALGTLGSSGPSASAVIITDRFGEIYAEYRQETALPSAEQIIEWLSFINSQCPECGAAEWIL